MISGVLNENPSISDLVLHDLRDTSSPKNGACGLTAEPALRCAIVKQMQQFSCENMAFHLSDSQNFRTFCRLSYGSTPNR